LLHTLVFLAAQEAEVHKHKQGVLEHLVKVLPEVQEIIQGHMLLEVAVAVRGVLDRTAQPIRAVEMVVLVYLVPFQEPQFIMVAVVAAVLMVV
jgi:hypothetical protein